MHLEDERKEYQEGYLSEKDLQKNPFDQVHLWLEEALSSSEIEPTACCLATSTKGGHVSSRMVLLKRFSEEGAFFFTHRTSKKGAQLEENPYASITLYWKTLERQLILEGPITFLSEKIVGDYFSKRPRKSQLGTYISHQGEVIPSRDFLLQKTKETELLFEGKPIPLPSTWAGYALKPLLIEIWQGRPSRLHDHFSYRKEGSGWKLERISP